MSDIEHEDIPDVSSSESSLAESKLDADYGVVNLGAGGIVPYLDKPILPEGIAEARNDEEEDIDRIPLESLEARFEKRIPVNQW